MGTRWIHDGDMTTKSHLPNIFIPQFPALGLDRRRR
jgi:hypothetical protein